jgi:membrane protein YdbS with pleckstrin-like domain
MTNQLIDSGFLDDACLSAPLPEQWGELPVAALTKRRLAWLLLALMVSGVILLLQAWRGSHWVFWTLLTAVALLFLACWCLLPLQVRRTRFLLRTQDFLLQSGVLLRKAVLIPLQRVQHVTITQGPLQKRFGLATLKVYTAGGYDAEAALADIEYPLAQTLSEQLGRLIPKGDPDDQQ